MRDGLQRSSTASFTAAAEESSFPIATRFRTPTTASRNFRKDKDLYTTINEFAIADTVDRAHDEAHGDYSTFAVTINGKTYLMGVPDKSNPIFWIR
jgi:hypothetical protein